MNMRKTGNLLIRENSKKSSRENGNPAATNTSFNKSGRLSKQLPSIEQFEMQKEMAKAENLTEQEQAEILKEAKKTVSRKVKKSETKIENEMISILEAECAKLGAQLQREKLENARGRAEIDRLRQNVSFLNEKLEKAYNDQSHLSKNHTDGKMEHKQLLQELSSVKNLLQRKQDELEYVKSQKDSSIEELKMIIQQKQQQIEQLTINGRNLFGEKQELEEQLQEKTKQAQYLRGSFEQKKKQWQARFKELEIQQKGYLEKKGEKITRFQADTQKLQDKLKEEETLRKKLTDKNKDLERSLSEQHEIKKSLQDQIASLKKRVNDLSILKSSNNTIMNQKIAAVSEENNKLKEELQALRMGKKNEGRPEKPVLFGATDYD